MLSEMLVSALVLYRKWLLLMSRCGMKRVFGGRQGYICPWIYFFCVCLSVKCTDLTPDMFETRTVDLHSVSFRWIVTRQPWISTPQSIGRRFSKSRGKWDQHTTLFFFSETTKTQTQPWRNSHATMSFKSLNSSSEELGLTQLRLANMLLRGNVAGSAEEQLFGISIWIVILMSRCEYCYMCLLLCVEFEDSVVMCNCMVGTERCEL